MSVILNNIDSELSCNVGKMASGTYYMSDSVSESYACKESILYYTQKKEASLTSSKHVLIMKIKMKET